MVLISKYTYSIEFELSFAFKFHSPEFSLKYHQHTRTFEVYTLYTIYIRHIILQDVNV